MITSKDYLMGRDTKYPISEELEQNALRTVDRANMILQAFGQPREVLSGYRPAEINAKVKGAAPMSKHITCEAVDLADKDGRLAKWCMDNLPWLSAIGLWMEHPTYTKGWVHLQTTAPKSGNRVFIPSVRTA